MCKNVADELEMCRRFLWCRIVWCRVQVIGDAAGLTWYGFRVKIKLFGAILQFLFQQHEAQSVVIDPRKY